jgi:ribonuclease D
VTERTTASAAADASSAAADASSAAADASSAAASAAFEDGHEAVHVITEQAEYLAAVESLRGGHGPVAVDAERASGYRYSQRAYLIQVFRRGSGVFLFDPIALASFAELQDAIGHVEWIFHAASQDLPCLAELGLVPDTIFDTELGARLAGLPRVGLGAVVETLLGIHLAKEHSAADWSTRPLPQAWLVYAALDVELLVDVRDAMHDRLDAAGKLHMATEEFAAVLVRPPKPPKADPWRKLSGMHALRGQRSLAIARSLWLARDAYAQEVDIAPGRTIPDGAIVAAAAANPSSRNELAAVKGFTGRASRTELSRWWAAVQEGQTTTDLPSVRGQGEPSLPPPRAWAERNPPADRRYKAARAAVTTRAEELDLPVENLLTPDSLRTVAWTPPAPVTALSIAEALAHLGARGWQLEETASLIANAFVAAEQQPTGDAAAES